MKILNKPFTLILTLGFLSLNGMEEGDTPFESENESNKEESHLVKKRREDEDLSKEQVLEEIKPRSLKIQAAIKAAELIDSGELEWKDLANLPEGLSELIYKFYIANTYFNNSVLEKAEDKNNETLLNLIAECRALFYELIIADSNSLDTFILALDEFFDFYIEDEFKLFHYIESAYSIELFAMIRIFLNLILNPSCANISELIYDYNISRNDNLAAEEVDKNREQFVRDFIYARACIAADKNYICLLKLLLDLNFISRDNMILLFEHTCNGNSRQILKLLSKKIKFEKFEFEDLLENRILLKSLNDSLSIVKYLFKLMKKLGINSKDVINWSYSLSPMMLNGVMINDQNSYLTDDLVLERTLLDRAAKAGLPNCVNFLLKNGANKGINNALSLATGSLEDYLSRRNFYLWPQFSRKKDEDNFRESKIKDLKYVIEILEKALI